MDRYVKPIADPAPVIVTSSVDSSNVRKGFGISSPSALSPAVSGRSTPVFETTQDDVKSFSKLTVKESASGGTHTSTTSTRNAQELFDKERGSEKDYIHMVVIGHVDAGKSTLMGHMLVDLNEIPQRAMHKYEQESRKLGKQSFMYAWVLDETGEERTRGITMDVGSTRFSTPSKIVN